MNRTGRNRGFTLIEMIIVVAIIAALTAIGIYSVVKGRQRVSVDRLATELKSSVSKARSLASVAGSRVGTPRLIYAGCPTAAAIAGANPRANQLWVTIDGATGTIEVPHLLAYNPATDQLTVTCSVWTVANRMQANNASLGSAAFDAPTGPVSFAFSPAGRVVFPPGVPAADLFFQLAHADETTYAFGFRVLPSGVICDAADPANINCNEDA